MFQSLSIIDHILLFIFLFAFYFFWGKSKYNIRGNSSFWWAAMVPIFLYSLILGSRYGWGRDYPSYKYKFENAFTFNEEQIGFEWMNKTMLWLGFNYVEAFITYSVIFITCSFILIRSYKKESKWMYALLIPATLILVNNAIRQGVGLSFVLLAIYFFDKKKWLYMILALIIGTSIHTTVLITAAMIAASYFFLKKPLNWKITIPLYIFFAFIFDSSKIGAISPYIERYITLSSSNKFQSYIDNSDVWFSKDAADADKYAQGWFTLLLSSFFYTAVIYLGYFALKYKPNKRILYLYNVTVVGIIFYRAVFLFEILRRLAEPLVMLNFITLGYSIYVFSTMFQKRSLIKFDNLKEKKSFDLSMDMYKISITLVLIYLVLFWGRFIFLNNTAKFFWNI